MKSYTDISQSLKLVKILPLESADMYWFRDDIEVPRMYPKDMMKDSVSVTCPCWSLAALIEVLPLIEGFKPIIDLDINQIRYEGKYRDELCFNENNPIDACYEMILKLYELNLL